MLLLDTSTLMYLPKCIELLRELTTTLTATKVKVIILVEVYCELQTMRRDPDTSTRQNADGGIKIIQGFIDDDSLEWDTEKDRSVDSFFADAALLAKVPKLSRHNPVVVITQDHDLANDILGIKRQRSVQRNHNIQILRATTMGGKTFFEDILPSR